MTRFFIWPGAGPAARADSTTAFARTAAAASSRGNMLDDIDVVRVTATACLLPASYYISHSRPIFSPQKHAGSRNGHHLTNSLINVCRPVAA